MAIRLLLPLLTLLLLLQGGLWVLARGLGVRLWRWAMVAGVVLPILLLLPWFDPCRLLVPTGGLVVPGGPSLPAPDPHSILNDAVFQFIPWELEVRHALKAGQLPLWSDVLDGGSSPWLNPQAGVLSPLAWLARPLPIQHFLLAMLAFKILVAVEGAWVLARRLGASRCAALFAGAGFGLGGGILAWSLFPHTAAAAFVPWVAAGAVGLVRRPRTGSVVATALATAALLLSGHPETALTGGLFAAGLALALRRRKHLWRGLTRAAFAALLGFLLAAPLLVPFARMVPHTQRSRDTVTQHRLAGEMRLNDPNSWFFESRGRFLLTPLSGHIFGRPYRVPFEGALSWPDSLSAYAGLVALGTGILALGSRRRRTAGALLLLGAVFLLLASHFLPLMRLLFLLPPLRVPAYARFLLLVPLAVSVAGALGVDGVCSRLGAWRGLVLATLAILCLADLLPWGRDLLPHGEPAMFYPRTALLDRVTAEVAEGGPWRVVGEDLLAYPGVLAAYGLADPRAHNPMMPVTQVDALGAAFDFAPSMARYFAPFTHPDQPLLDFLNVKVVISNRFQPPPASFERIDHGEFEPYWLWRNPDVLPRWFFARGPELLPSGEAVNTLAGRPGVLAFTFEARGEERLLATSLPGPRGWRAVSSEGVELELVTLHGAYTGVRVPQGTHSLTLRYRPPGFLLGVILAGLAGLALLSLAWGVIRNRHAARGAHRAP